MPWNLLSLKYTSGSTHAPIKHRVNEQAAHKLQTEFIRQVPSQMWCQRLSCVYSELDTWDTSSTVLSLAKWILHWADMWYLNFLLQGEYVLEWKKLCNACAFYRKQWRGTLLRSCCLCHSGDKDEVMEEGGEMRGFLVRKLLLLTGSPTQVPLFEN